jgi:hypothetical protein
MPYVFCPRCGAKVEWGAYCSLCGARIPEWDTAPGEKKTVESPEHPPPSKEGQGTRRQWLRVSLLVLALVLVGAFWVRSYSQSFNSPNQRPEPIPASLLLASPPSPNYAPSSLDKEFMRRYGHPYYDSTQQEQAKIETPKLEALLGNIEKQVQFTEKYQEDYFDCSEMSAYVEYYLERNDYQASIFISTSFDHAWVMVYSTEGWIPIEATGLFIPTPANCKDYYIYSEPDERYDSIGVYWDSFQTMSEVDWWQTKYADTLKKLAEGNA